MRILAVLFGFALLALVQIPTMIRKRWWRDLTVYTIVYLTALIVALSYVLDWPVLSPVKLLTTLMNTIYRFLGYEVPE